MLRERDSHTLMLNNMISSQLTAHTHQLLFGTKTFHNYSLASADTFLKMHNLIKKILHQLKKREVNDHAFSGDNIVSELFGMSLVIF